MSTLEIQKNINLKNFSTFKIGGTAKYFAIIRNKVELQEAINFAKENNLKIYILGCGSNTIFTDKVFEGLILKIEIKGFDVIKTETFIENEEKSEMDHDFSFQNYPTMQKYNHSTVTIKIGAGEIWDQIVEKTVDMGLAGFEHMSLIPGTVGASPVQNIEAYRQEVSETLVELEAFDIKANKFITLKKSECGFGYRTSIFKTTEKGRFIITSITFKLFNTDGEPIKIDKEVEKYFLENNIQNPKIKDIRKAVIDIRNSKLYDPEKIPNCGSFFENIIVSKEKFLNLQKKYPDIFYFELEDGNFKIPTGWLIQHSNIEGLDDVRGYRYKNLMISEKHALTILNPEGKAEFNEVLELVDIIVKAVKQKFDIEIEPEPNLIC